MSMNENLEVRVSELTNVIRGLSDKPQLSASDVNGILSNLIQKVEDKNEEGIVRLTNEVSESLIDVLERKNLEIKERLAVFENFVTTVEKTFENTKLESEITRILNDIEALHSKMNSQEIQTEALVKAFDSMKNNSSTNQVAKLCDEILSISKSYDGIVEVLNNNFQEFLRRVENSSSREDYQRLRYMIEAIEGSQNVLVSSVNAVNEKQEEIKNLLRQSTGSMMVEKIENIQNFLNQMNRNIVDGATKADLEIIVDKIGIVSNLINEFKRQVDEASDSDIRAVFQGQLNNIIAQLENLKANSNANVNEDIIRLYTSIAEFRDAVNLAINTQLNDVVTSMDVQFDKITNSVVNATLDATETVNNVIGEVQKLNSFVADGFNSKTYEIKDDIQKVSQEAIVTIVNSIKGELSSLLSEVSSLNNNDSLNNLFYMIENLKNGLDIDSIVVQIDQIKAALDFEPIKEQLALLNKDETIRLINEKIDLALEYLRDNEQLIKIEELGNSNKQEILSKIYETNSSLNNEITSKLNEISQSNKYEILSKIDEIKGSTENILSKVEVANNQSNNEILSKIDEIKNSSNDTVISRINELTSLNKQEILDKIDEVKGTSNESLVSKIDDLNSSINNEITSKMNEISQSNKYEILSKIDEVKGVSGDTIVSKLDELKSSINNEISAKIDESQITANSEILSKIDEMKMASNIEVLSKLDELKEVSNNEGVYPILESINRKIEEKISQDIENNKDQDINEIKDNLKTLYQAIIDNNGEESVQNLSNKLDENLNNINSKVEDSFENAKINLENSLNVLSEKINSIDSKLVNNDEEKLDELRSQIELLYDFIKDVNSNPISEQIESLKQNLSALSVDNIQEVKQEIEEFQNTLVATLSAVKNKLSESLDKDNLSTSFYPLFDEFETRLNDKIASIETLIEETADVGNEKFKSFAQENLENIKVDIKTTTSAFIEQAISSQTDLIVDLLKNQASEARLEVANYLKQESEILTAFVSEKAEFSQKEIIAKVSQMLNAKENSEARVSLIKNITESLSEILGNTNLIKDGFETNSDVINQLNGTISVLDSKFEDFITKNSAEVDEKLNQIIANFSILKTNVADLVLENNSDIKKSVASLSEKLEQSGQRIDESNGKIEKAVALIGTNINKGLGSIQDKIETLLTNDREENKNQIESVKEVLTQAVATQILEQLKEEVEEIKSSITNQLVRNEGNIDSLMNFTNEFDSKMLERTSMIEDIVSDKIEFLVSQVKQEYEAKLADVQKIIDDRVYDVLNRNNEVIKDELKLRADATLKDISKDLKDRFSKIENAITKNGITIDDEDAAYTMADIESDIAKIRLGLEKNNKLTNFKEFASRLVELKNINLENAKISRVIGADIMRFDGWLKNTTAKIEVLAAKIDKSEKIKMEDLKSRLIQTEKNQSMPQKLEEAIMSIYKKYRSQETKIDDLINKIENLNQKQTDHFDVREFIDVIYDTTKKQENLISRMDNIEDKMDLIQAKIDHIISSCIDE